MTVIFTFNKLSSYLMVSQTDTVQQPACTILESSITSRESTTTSFDTRENVSLHSIFTEGGI